MDRSSTPLLSCHQFSQGRPSAVVFLDRTPTQGRTVGVSSLETFVASGLRRVPSRPSSGSRPVTGSHRGGYRVAQKRVSRGSGTSVPDTRTGTSVRGVSPPPVTPRDTSRGPPSDDEGFQAGVDESKREGTSHRLGVGRRTADGRLGTSRPGHRGPVSVEVDEAPPVTGLPTSGLDPPPTLPGVSPAPPSRRPRRVVAEGLGRVGRLGRVQEHLAPLEAVDV